MHMRFGKHAGKTTEKALIADPDWAQFTLKNEPNGAVSRSLQAHISAVDRKPFDTKCHGCAKRATRASVYKENTGGFVFWCEECDPYSTGARDGTLSIVRTFADAMRHADFTCDGTKAAKKAIFRRLAEAKGLPKRANDQALANFF